MNLKTSMNEPYPDNFLITHIGEGKFIATLEDGDTKRIGPSLSGIIRYTYFEDFTLPEEGWTCEHSKLMEDYFPKVFEDVKSGKISKDKFKNDYIK